MAGFCDSLNPLWLYDRRTVQCKEVTASFCRFAKIPADAPVMVGDISDIIYDFTGTRAVRNCASFVQHLREIGANHPLEKTFRDAYDGNEKNAERFLAGQFTDEMIRKFDRLYVESLLPNTTPAGIAIDRATKNQFLDAYTLTDLPATALETKITRENWALKRKLTPNNFLDQQHVIALPYVSLFITNDETFSRLMKRSVEGMPFRTAEVLAKTEFDVRFPVAAEPTRTKTPSSLTP